MTLKTILTVSITGALSATACAEGRSTSAATSAPPAAVVTQSSDWNGGQKQSFALAGYSAYVVVPTIAAPGKPWVWRTSFPDFHAEVDVELLHQGYHIAHLDVLNLLGSESALDAMDQFYAQVRSQWGLAEKMALEGVSRGGLHAYRYAARHPERIACIYADTPVMDIKCWPRKRADSQGDWALVLKNYGFADDAAAMAFKGNPLDLLAPIAKAKIPLRHVISLNDKVVPPEENSLEAKRRLRKLGHDMEIVAVKEGNACDGHHFPLPEVYQSAQFIMRYAHVMPAQKEYFELRSGLANCKAQFLTAKTGRVAFLGGSITYNGGWRDEVMRDLQQRFPDTKFDFIAAGIPSVGSVGHAFRLERDILMRGPVDLLFVEAAVNDHNYDGMTNRADLALFGMEGVVRHLRAVNPMTDIVEMHFIDPSDMPLFRAGQVPYPIAAHEQVAARYQCPSLDLALEVTRRIDAGEFTWEGDFRDLHPSPYGQRVYASSMIRMLDAGFATTARAKTHRLPKPLSKKSYAQGHFGKLENAVMGQGFTLDPKWHPATGNTRDGFVDVPALVAAAPGSTLTYEFDGTGIGLFLAAGYDTCVLEFQVDGKPFAVVDTYAPWSGGLHLPWPVMLADGLKSGKHKLTLRTTDKVKTRTALHIIQILLN